MGLVTDVTRDKEMHTGDWWGSLLEKYERDKRTLLKCIEVRMP
jgi:hypothetical protein